MCKADIMPNKKRHLPRDFLERMALSFANTLQIAFDADTLASKPGFLQSLDPRFKLASLLLLIVSTILTQSLLLILFLFCSACLLAVCSHIGLRQQLARIWISVLLFTGLVALPSLVLVPGDPVGQIPFLDWHITEQGLRSAVFLLGRAETAATFALILMLSTPWTQLLKAMRALGVPVVLVALLGMTHRYIFVLLTSTTDLIEARRSRMVAKADGPTQRKMIMAAAGVLLHKAFNLSAEVHLAMISRGYRGEVYTLNDFRSSPRDWLVLATASLVPTLIIWAQR